MALDQAKRMQDLYEDNKRLRQAASEVLDIFDQGDTSEAWQVAMLKLRTALGISGRTYEQSAPKNDYAGNYAAQTAPGKKIGGSEK